MGRIIIFTGKGGVGKTSVAAAHAVKAAKSGKRTLIVSTDMAHNLGDIFEMAITSKPIEVINNLEALEIDPNKEMGESYESITNAFKNMLGTLEGTNTGELEDIVVYPGSEEIFSLIKIKELYDKNIYDLIIVDCAPTGESLSLLKFPELLSWYMEKLFPIGKVALKVLRPIAKATFKIEMPHKIALNDIEKLYIKLRELQELLRDREICSIRIVTIPEKMVVEESKRNYMYLNLYNFNVDALYINRIIPVEVENEFFNEWKGIQKGYINELEAVFGDIPIYKIKWYEKDINGVVGLERVSQESFCDDNIFNVLKVVPNETFQKVNEGYLLKILIPFVDKKDFDLYHSGRELIIKIGNFKRNIPIPDVMVKCEVKSAKLEDSILTILFE